jgi:two-component system, LuxR family, response regulator FixJ
LSTPTGPFALRDPARGLTVFIVEDETDDRDALAFHLMAMGHHVQAYGAAEPFLAALDPAIEGCVISNLHLPGLDGLALITELARRGSVLPVVVVTGDADVPLAVRAMKLGAVDFLEKPFAEGAIGETVQRALQSARETASLKRQAEAAAGRIATLSGRERDVFNGLVAGKLGKQIAYDLHISPRTVEVYRASTMEKLGVNTLSELVRLGILTELHKSPL